jgi:hypothetical protein
MPTKRHISDILQKVKAYCFFTKISFSVSIIFDIPKRIKFKPPSAQRPVVLVIDLKKMGAHSLAKNPSLEKRPREVKRNAKNVSCSYKYSFSTPHSLPILKFPISTEPFCRTVFLLEFTDEIIFIFSIRIYFLGKSCRYQNGQGKRAFCCKIEITSGLFCVVKKDKITLFRGSQRDVVYLG